jgi:hypothetical protein
MRKAYQTDLADAEWGYLESHPVYFTSIRSDPLAPLAVRYISVLLNLRRCFEPAALDLLDRLHGRTADLVTTQHPNGIHKVGDNSDAHFSATDSIV